MRQITIDHLTEPDTIRNKALKWVDNVNHESLRSIIFMAASEFQTVDTQIHHKCIVDIS